MFCNPNILNRTGLVLGLISGLLLIPEIVKYIDFDKISKWLDNTFTKFDRAASVPVIFHPAKWKILFRERDRKDILEPITAISSFLFSIAWVSSLYIGLSSKSKFFIILSFFLPLYSLFQKILDFIQSHGRKSIIALIKIIFISGTLILFISPIISFFRVILLIIRFIIIKIQFLLIKHKLEKIFLIFAIITFIFSNIFQIIATFCK